MLDLQWIQIPYFSKHQNVGGEVEAGYVVKSHADLKRRGSNSLVWEPAKEKDILYYKDSVLTLAQSTAKLYLNDKTELELSENTLVTLELPDDRSKSEIRLRFSKGDLHARNPLAKTKIQGDDWVVDLDKGSEVALRKEKDSYEFEVVTGTASLQTKSGVQSLQNSKILRLGENQQIQQIEKTDALKWTEEKPQRIYVFEDEAHVLVQWSGSAKSLAINKTGEAPDAQSLQPGQQKAEVPLKLGNYKLRLQDESGLSIAKEIEIWKAPKIYLKKPMSRDRLSAGQEYEFVWSSEPGIKEYEVKITECVHGGEAGAIKCGGTPANTRTIKAGDKNFVRISFEGDKDVSWSVEGRDEDEHLIPSSIENKIFIREDPLAAPKLKTPKLHELPESNEDSGKNETQSGKSSGNFHWWQLFFSEAYAVGFTYEVVFEWEAVPGADHYTIEVSTDPEFKQPELVQKESSTRYLWKGYKRQKKYYWRVAAGNSRKMGIFSEPTELKPELVKTVRAKGPSAQIPSEPSVPVAVSVPDSKNASAIAHEDGRPETSVSQSTDQIPARYPVFGLALTPTFKALSIKAEDAKINLAGALPRAFQLQFRVADFFVEAAVSAQTWKPKSDTDLPTQQNLTIPQGHLIIEKNLWGLALDQTFIPTRMSAASIDFKAQTLAGIHYKFFSRQSESSAAKFGIGFLTSGRLSEASLDYEFKKYLNSTEKFRFYIGGGAKASVLSGKFTDGYDANLILLLGFDNF